VRTVVIVGALPFSELLSEIDIALVGKQLVELLLVSSVGSLRLAVELRGSRLDVNVPDPLVGYVPVEFCLEIIGPGQGNPSGSRGRTPFCISDRPGRGLVFRPP
jgi:hypothetical protein